MRFLAVISSIVLATPAFAQPPKMTELPKDLPPFKYVDAKIPFYPPAGKRDKRELSQMQLPIPVAESIKHMVTPADFDVRVVASDPEIRRPICMNWDERGRLWIAESVDYPNNRQPAGKGNDRIVICEDTDGDGKMDKFTVFADKLSIPTSFCFANGGVIVHQAPHTLFLRDTDGDDVADERKILFSGWGTGDTHAGPSNLRYGFDNWIYGVVGYSGFRGTVGGEKHAFGSGIYRFKPDGSKLEFLRSTSNNTWGLGFSEDGLLFASTANGCPSVYLPIPNRYYESVRGWSSSVLQLISTSNRFYPITDKVRQVDFHGGFTAAAGHALYTARLYPKYYWNRTAFVAEPTGHLVATFELERKGTDFVAKNSWNLLASDDEWTAPIMAEVGPDGCVWIIDWYNYIVQHNPTPVGFKTGKGAAYETPLRDKKHGRIVKLVPKGAKLPVALDLKKATPKELVATLKNDNLFWRLHAQRLLVERGKGEVVGELINLVKQDGVDELGFNVGAVHALRAIEGLREVAGKAVVDAGVTGAQHKSPAVRLAAASLLHEHSASPLVAAIGYLAIHDPDPQVRLAAILSLSEQPADGARSNNCAQILLGALRQDKNLKDRWITDALAIGGARHAEEFLVSLGYVIEVKSPFPPRARDVLARVSEHYARSSPKRVEVLLSAWKSHDPAETEVLIRGLVKGWPRDSKLKKTTLVDEFFTRNFPRLSPAGKADLLRLSEAWGIGGVERFGAEIAKSLWGVVESEKEGDTARVNAAKQLVDLFPKDDKAVARILVQITPRSTPDLAAGLLDALTASAALDLAPALLKSMPEFSPAARTSALRVLLVKAATTKALLDSVDAGRASLTDLSLDQKQALLTHPDKGIAERAKKLLALGGSLPSADRQKVIDQFLPLLAKKADPAGGKLMFKKHCAVCHMHNGEGAKVGPDLTGMAVHPKNELIVHILDPSRSVEGNFRIYIVSTLDGRVLNGMLASESKTAIELIDATAKKTVLQREDIETLKATPRSLMPDGFEKQMSEQELLDLLEFLTQRGRYFPLPVDRAANVVSTLGMFFAKESPVERMTLAEWTPRTVKGVPFTLTDPRGDHVPNIIMLYGPNGTTAPKMPRSVKLPCNAPAKAIHFLSGVSGWGYPYSTKSTVSMIVRLHYEDGKTEDHELLNGKHFADYIRRTDVPGSEFAFSMGGKQMRYLAIHPKRDAAIREVELVKPDGDASAPLVLAVTVEGKE